MIFTIAIIAVAINRGDVHAWAERQRAAAQTHAVPG